MTLTRTVLTAAALAAAAVFVRVLRIETTDIGTCDKEDT